MGSPGFCVWMLLQTNELKASPELSPEVALEPFKFGGRISLKLEQEIESRGRESQGSGAVPEEQKRPKRPKKKKNSPSHPQNM